MIGVISDTHTDTFDASMARVVEGVLAEADVIIHAGDHTGADVVEHLEHVEARPYYGVSGNMDFHTGAGRLPVKRTVELGGVTIGIVHGSGSGVGLEKRVVSWFDPLPDVIIFGHSHRPLVKRIGSLLLVNPGSPFWPRGSGVGTVAMIEVTGTGIGARIVEVGG